MVGSIKIRFINFVMGYMVGRFERTIDFALLIYHESSNPDLVGLNLESYVRRWP